VTNLLIREWLNGGLIPLNVCIIIVISYSLLASRRVSGPGWTKEPGVASACAFWWLFVADLIRAIMAWLLLHAEVTGRSPEYLGYAPTLLYMASAAIAMLATFRLIYTLSPASWGHKAWLAAAGLTVAFIAGLSLIN
jgi:hypothetical protein